MRRLLPAFGLVAPLLAQGPLALLPLPQHLEQGAGSHALPSPLRIQGPREARGALADLRSRLEARGLKVGAGPRAVQLETVKGLAREGYRLRIRESGVHLQASEPAGFFYGVKTLDQLLGAGTRLPHLEIRDQPRFAWRALMLDVSRHFFTVAEVKALLDRMAEVKLNVLHLHLTDDQGWRLEIKALPELTRQGAWRSLNAHDEACLARAQEDPAFALPPDRLRQVEGQTRYGGFYTQAEMRDLLAYAAARHIMVVPEIDMPGHLKAALDAYPHLSCSGRPAWGATFSTPACPTKEATYRFAETVLGEVAALFPAPLIHIGGDEVATEHWKDCPSCQEVMTREGLKDLHALQTRFNARIQAFLKTRGKRMAAWDEVAEGPLDPTTTLFWWRNWAPQTLERASREAHSLVITPNFQYYFDFRHDQTPLDKVYTYEPVPEAFTPEQARRIIGIQGNLWTEYIPSDAQLQVMGFPRALALAERAWSPATVKDPGAFQARLRPLLDRDGRLGRTYHLPPIEGLPALGVFVHQATVDLRVPLPDQEIRFTLDGSLPTLQSPQWTGPLVIERSCTLRARSFRHGLASEVYEGRFTQEAPRLPAFPPETALAPGLRRYKIPGRFEKARDVAIPADTPATVVGVPSPEQPRQDFYGLVFEGFFLAPTPGVYTFTTHSDDGDVFYVGDRLVVDNDGSHGERPAQGQIALAAGWHPVRHLFRQLGGGQALRLEVQTPDTPTRPVQPHDFGRHP